MPIDSTRQQLIESLKDKEYRDAFVCEEIHTGIAFQIRANREHRGWTQQRLGQMAGGARQAMISRLESPNYGKMTLKTLKTIAAAFDVALIVRFAPFSQLVDYLANLRPDNLAVPEFSEDQKLFQEPSRYENVAVTLSFFGDVNVEDLKPEIPESFELNWHPISRTPVEERTEIPAGRIAGMGR